MNDTDDQDNQDLPIQTSSTNTSNWDDRVSTGPSGEKYIRTTAEDEASN